MPKLAKTLSAIEVTNLKTPGHHAVGGVPGLALQITDSGARSWVLRVLIGSKRRDVGLGAFPTVKLADARRLAAEHKELIRKGIDPVEERRKARAALVEAQAPIMTFMKAAREVHAIIAPTLKNDKYRKQWIEEIERHCSTIGGVDVGILTNDHILEVLTPIWATKTATAAKIRDRLEKILDWAKVKGYRHGDNPAQWKGNLEALLPKPSKIAQKGHFKAMPYKDLPAFMQQLRAAEGLGARALEFLIMTVVRSANVREAKWDEIDFDEKTWSIPGNRMKTGHPHVVPLPESAVDFLRALPRLEGTDIVFPSTRSGIMSDMTISAVMRRMGLKEVPHGFRSTFSDWVSEETNHPEMVREMALAHVIKNKTEAAYRRGDLLAKRRRLMEDWSDYIYTKVN